MNEEETSYWDLDTLVAAVREARDLTQESRQLADKCRTYFDGDQWTKAEREELARRKQPVQERNRIRKKVNLMAGLEQSRRTDPKAFPRDVDGAIQAEVATRVVRTNCDRMRFDRLRSRCFKDLLIEGTAAVLHGIKQTRQGPVTTASRIRLQDFIYDPQSLEEDFADASYLGRGRYIPVGQVKMMFPGQDIDEAALRTSLTSELADREDRIKDSEFWYEAKTRRAYVVQLYYREAGEWLFATFIGTQILEQGVSPFLDDDGRTVCPIIAQSCYVGLDLMRYGIVRDMISAQDGLNKRSSKLLALLSTNQTWSRKGIVGDIKKFKAEKASLDGHLEFDGEWGSDFGTIDRSQEILGHARLYELELQEMESQGANPGLAGRISESASGRALQARQQAGLREENDSFDAMADWTLRFYLRDLEASKQFYTDERKIRIGGTPEAPKFLTLNMDAANPMVPTRNPMAEVSVDMVLDTGPDTVTIRQEQFERIIELAKVNPQAFPPEVLMELGEFTTETKRLIEEAQGGGDDPQAQQMRAMQAQMQQAFAQLELQEKQLDNAKTQAEIQQITAKVREIMANVAETEAEIRGQHPDQFMDAAKLRASMMERAAAA